MSQMQRIHYIVFIFAIFLLHCERFWARKMLRLGASVSCIALMLALALALRSDCWAARASR